MCVTSVIPVFGNDVTESDHDSNWLDREYQHKTGYLPVRLLNGEARVTYPRG